MAVERVIVAHVPVSKKANDGEWPVKNDSLPPPCASNFLFVHSNCLCRLGLLQASEQKGPALLSPDGPARAHAYIKDGIENEKTFRGGRVRRSRRKRRNAFVCMKNMLAKRKRKSKHCVSSSVIVQQIECLLAVVHFATHYCSGRRWASYSLCVRLDHDVTIDKDGANDEEGEQRVREDVNGDPADRMERRQQEHGLLGGKPVEGGRGKSGFH